MASTPSATRRPSLKARALQMLARRDHSRLELRRKLIRVAREDARAVAGTPGAPAVLAAPDQLLHPSQDRTGCATDIAERVDAVLEWLQAQQYLSDQRFAEVRAHARAERFGIQRIRRELAEHGVALAPAIEDALKDSELPRARSLLARRCGEGVPDARARAKLARFLAGRGFSGDVIRKALDGLGRDPSVDDDASVDPP